MILNFKINSNILGSSVTFHWSRRTAKTTSNRMKAEMFSEELPEVRVAPYWSRSCRATPLVQPKPNCRRRRWNTAKHKRCFSVKKNIF